jgi:hypothetical protein
MLVDQNFSLEVFRREKPPFLRKRDTITKIVYEPAGFSQTYKLVESLGELQEIDHSHPE